ncbi:MAG: DUF853 family protein [Candidatus Diapherotrites archaeon]|nr:DUF853 family protein [Candidatus Diapherotrites archaeon]
MADSVYDNDRVEKSIDTSDDIFDDVFGEDDEKKASKQKLKAKAEELSEKEKKKRKTEEDAEEEEDDESEEEDEDSEEDEEETDDDEEEDDEEEAEDEEDSDEDESEEEPELFLDKAQAKDLEKKARELEKKINPKKSKSNYNQIVKEGLAKSIEAGITAGSAAKVKEVTGKLNLKVEIDEEEIIKPKKKTKATPLEKNIIKNVIKNKANKATKKDDLADYLLKEHGTKEEGASAEWGFEKEAEVIGEKAELDALKAENANVKTKIKPKINFLMNEVTGNAYIGRKKSVLKKYGDQGGLHIGRVGEEELSKTPIYLDGLNPHVVFVCGARGSGKSYVLGVLAEELALKNKNVGIVVVDPIGVFWSMKHPNRDEKELELLAEWEIMPQGLDNLKVLIPVGMKDSVPKSTYNSTFSIQPSLLTAEDWALTFGMDRFSPTGLLLDKVLEKIKKGYTTKGDNPKQVRGKEQTYSIDDLVNCLEFDSELNDREKGYKPESIRAITSRFDAAKSWGIFDEAGTPLSMISRAGQMTILDTSFLDDTVSALVIGIISRRLLSARKLSTRREAAGKFEDNGVEDLVEINVPPTWLFIDEAHTLIPGGNSKTPASKAIVEYVKQGRRPGLSLVFATQQPSAIDSKVLSQLDVIMAHKLVFDDDVKAIQKRTPTIIPAPYKKPNFIKTLPVGTALTGDRQETTARAFVMNIRPRMSQHEGRDAETIEVKHDMGQEQVELLAMRITLKKLEKDPSIKIETLEQIIETLESTYKKKIAFETVQELLEEQGVEFDEERLYAKGVLAEMEAEEAAENEEEDAESEDGEENEESEEDSEDRDEEDDDENDSEDDEEETDDDEDEDNDDEEYEASVELTALQPTVVEAQARLLLAKLRLKKALGLFGEEEIVDRLGMKYATLYKIRYNYFSQKDAFQVGEAYINSQTGEFIHDNKGSLVESVGLPQLLHLNEAEILAVKLLESKHDIHSLSENMGMEPGNVKRVLEKLAEKDMVKVEKQKDRMVYNLKEKIDLPPSPLHAIMPSIGKRPIIEVESVPLLRPNIEEKEAVDLIKKVWKNISVKEVTHLFLPVWEGVLKKKTGEERVVRIDAINGRQIK